MALNTDFVGRSYPPSGPYAVTAADIAAFAAAVGADDPVHTEVQAARAAGYPDVVAPPTFLVRFEQASAAAYVADPQAQVDFTRIVHGQQSFEHQRPVVAGDELTTVTTVESIRSAGGHSMVTLRTQIDDAAGEPVCTARSMLVVRGGE